MISTTIAYEQNACENKHIYIHKYKPSNNDNWCAHTVGKWITTPVHLKQILIICSTFIYEFTFKPFCMFV